MKILLTGANGQLGSVLAESLPEIGEVFAATRADADFYSPDSLRELVRQIRPDVVVNAAAYTAVDRAENEEENANIVNAIAPGVLAEAARECGAFLVHYSTDFVFDGEQRTPYREVDSTNPINAYGRSKLRGEKRIIAANGDSLILRTSWVYGAHGKNFFNTIIDLAQSREHLQIVSDQVGAPTTVYLISDITIAAIEKAYAEVEQRCFESAILHLVAAGEVSWYGFAKEIIDNARNYLGDDAIRVRDLEPVSSETYKTPAERPQSSTLAIEKIQQYVEIELPNWRQGLDECLRIKFDVT